MKDTARGLHPNCQRFSACLVCFRIGLVFVVSDEDDVDGMQDAGVALVRAYNYISNEVDSQSAFDAVISVSPHQPIKFNTVCFCLYNCSFVFLWHICALKDV